MPELPEVETTINGLKNKVLNRTFVNVWTDIRKIIKRPISFNLFLKELKGRRIKGIRRRGKNIIFELSDNYSLLIHQKLTGHLLYGIWENRKGRWLAEDSRLNEKVNSYIHLIFFLDNKKMIALSDLRKFAKVQLWKNNELADSKEFKSLGPEPLDKDFNFNVFKKRLRKGAIKEVLMDQKVIVGIGNIYSDEILWEARVHPLRDASKLTQEELKRIYLSLKKILKKAVKAKGTSISDYRTITGDEGGFGPIRKVYQRTNKKCFYCGAAIERIKIKNRSAHFCPNCQKLL
ncbi:MAG: DNA-formamidopyrimidine glycosylase [Candidatus Pacebacteria bacterium]|nr:DNA-formamidopyrimidine glycosylase [Candidatus Paceibacterota bacterium]